MQLLEGSGTPVLYIGRTVLKGYARSSFLETNSFSANKEILRIL